MHTWDFLKEFLDAFEKHLKADEVKWRDTWLKRTRKGQEGRTWDGYKDKFDQFFNAGQPIDWLAIAGDALICWIREKHPEIWPE